jgi:hypothetical protein
MVRPVLEVADIFRDHGPAWRRDGILVVTDDGTPACEITSNHVADEGLKTLLRRDKEMISPHLRFEWSVERLTVENAFVALMRQRCGYAAGDADALRNLMVALGRDGKQYYYAPIWYSPEEVITSGKEVIKSRDAEENTKEANNSIDEAIRGQRASQKQAIEQGLRNQYGPRARGLSDRIQSVVKKAADNPLNGSVRRATETQRLFPTFSTWLNQRFDEQWETTDVTSDISDYGTVQWNGRALEGIIVQLKIMQRNRILGLNKPGCFVFGEVDDVEFSMQRNLVDVECETSDAKLAAWKARREFKSLWNAE